MNATDKAVWLIFEYGFDHAAHIAGERADKSDGTTRLYWSRVQTLIRARENGAPHVIASTRIVRSEDEFIVRAFDAAGLRLPSCDYFTNDRADAQATAKAMVKGAT